MVESPATKEELISAGRQHGRKLAERIMAQARRYALEPRDMALMFVEDRDNQSKAMQALGMSTEEIAVWTEAATAGCRSRIREEAGDTEIF